jgi:lysozyme
MVTPELVEFLKGWEKFRAVAYPATEDERKRGIWTYGFGHTRGVKQGDTCTEEQATRLLVDRLVVVEDELREFVKRTPSPRQWDALVSLGDNCGVKGENKVGPSGLVRLFNQERDQECADRFLLWNKQSGVVVNGLSKRRAAERAIYLQGDYSIRP